MSDIVVDVTDLWNVVGGQVVHRGISLQARRGEILSVIGGSGSGKTTLLRTLIGLRTPTRGTVRVLDLDLRRAGRQEQQSLRLRWGVLFQGGALFSALPVFDNVALPLRELHLLDRQAVRDLVMLKLGMVGLEPGDAPKLPAELSGGMVKRAALARALALDPELLFLDEPTSGLDPVSAVAFQLLIRNLRHSLGLSVVMVTHDLDTLAALSDRVAVLADGTLVAVGTLAEVSRVDHPFIQEYFRGERGLPLPPPRGE